MADPDFLSLVDVLAVHAASIERFGGAPGIRDLGLLESAIAVPQATMFGSFLHPTIEEQAAAYLFHVVQNHPFLDGNKRAGLGSALIFLGLNGSWIEATNDELIELTLGVAKHDLSKSAVAEFFREHRRPWKR